MLNFAVGPVQSNEEVREIGSLDVPYFRTEEFSQTMLENESIMLELLHAHEKSRAVFVTGSGTAGMESVVSSLLGPNDKVLVIDGGSFGHRFVELCELYNIPHEALRLKPGTPLFHTDLIPYENYGFTSLIVNIHETSTGILYNSDIIGDFCKRNGLFLIVDAISSFLADPLDMSEMSADVVIVGSQKGLACPPGIAGVVLSPNATKRAYSMPMRSMYLDLRLLLENGVRGQTPFTPAVGTLIQINARLKSVKKKGLDSEIASVAMLASDFRSRISELPMEARLVSPSNACTYLTLNEGFSARSIFQTLKNEYGIWICPNGGKHADTSFRVGHMGNLSLEANTSLITALQEICL